MYINARAKLWIEVCVKVRDGTRNDLLEDKAGNQIDWYTAAAICTLSTEVITERVKEWRSLMWKEEFKKTITFIFIWRKHALRIHVMIACLIHCTFFLSLTLFDFYNKKDKKCINLSVIVCEQQSHHWLSIVYWYIKLAGFFARVYY